MICPASSCSSTSEWSCVSGSELTGAEQIAAAVADVGEGEGWVGGVGSGL